MSLNRKNCMYSVKKVYDECLEDLKALRAEIDDWLDENTGDYE